MPRFIARVLGDLPYPEAPKDDVFDDLIEAEEFVRVDFGSIHDADHPTSSAVVVTQLIARTVSKVPIGNCFLNAVLNRVRRGRNAVAQRRTWKDDFRLNGATRVANRRLLPDVNPRQTRVIEEDACVLAERHQVKIIVDGSKHHRIVMARHVMKRILC